MFFRPDFLSLTICVVGLFLISQTDQITKGKFRVLVLMIFISIIYDTIWLFIKHSEYAAEEKTNDGNSEAGIRRFALTMSYASFFLRVRIFI